MKNIQFTKILKADGSLREFNFRRAIVNDKMIFHVDVTDSRGTRIAFQLEKQDDGWKILSLPVPAWISTVENSLHELIEQEL